jgi:hypothetical protein
MDRGLTVDGGRAGTANEDAGMHELNEAALAWNA